MSLVFSVLYLGAVIFLHGGTEPIHRLVSLLPEMIPWNKAPSPPLPSEVAGSADHQSACATAADDSGLLHEEAS
jgi:hypothetical protein